MSRREHFDLGHGKPLFQMEYSEDPNDEIERHRIHVTPHNKENIVGEMTWSGFDSDKHGVLEHVGVDPQFQRHGIATAMWNFARRLSEEDPSIHKVIPSNFRTRAGDEWAHELWRKGLSEAPPDNTMDPDDEDEYGR